MRHLWMQTKLAPFFNYRLKFWFHKYLGFVVKELGKTHLPRNSEAQKLSHNAIANLEWWEGDQVERACYPDSHGYQELKQINHESLMSLFKNSIDGEDSCFRYVEIMTFHTYWRVQCSDIAFERKKIYSRAFR